MRLGGLLGHLRAILEASKGVLEASGGGLEASRGGPGVQEAKPGAGFQVPRSSQLEVARGIPRGIRELVDLSLIHI